jgi:hypothetical protein
VEHALIAGRGGLIPALPLGEETAQCLLVEMIVRRGRS